MRKPAEWGSFDEVSTVIPASRSNMKLWSGLYRHYENHPTVRKPEYSRTPKNMRAFWIPASAGMTIACFVVTTHLHAADTGTTGAAFLKLGVGARAMSMGEAYTAVAEGSEALFWNPAGIGRSVRPTFLLGYSPVVEEASHSQAAFATRLKKWGIGAGYKGLKHSPIDAYDDVGNKTGDYSASDNAGKVGLSMGGDGFQIGLSGTYWSSVIDSVSSDGFAGDAGIFFRNPFAGSLRHALVVRNVGGKISFIAQEDPLPLIASFGNSLALGNRVTIAGDVSHEKGTGAIVAGGVEIALFSSKFLALRGGYTTRRNEIEKLSGASFGIGLALGALNLDYGWVPFGRLGESHVVSLLWKIPEFKSASSIQSPAAKKSANDHLSNKPARRKRTLEDLDKK